MTSSQISAAGATAQAERMVVSIPVRAIDPTRKRFEVEDKAAAGQAPIKSRQDQEAASDGQSSDDPQAALTGGWGRSGFGLLGAFTSFLTRMFAQATETPAAPAAASLQAGAAAYARSATAVESQQGNAAEVLSPSYPRLSSGRAIDLTV